ncbi:MAG: Spy/CpxP family protein refolding chaperone [Bacteroidales bacterium]|jgi:Spy/CpxP family protein refolding chaperone|nr:Spy/CpxP family protein refolding chaperone [Bacteroidales bacterium]
MMKMKLFMAVSAILVSVFAAVAQPDNRRTHREIPLDVRRADTFAGRRAGTFAGNGLMRLNLTEEQQKEIRKIMTAQMKEQTQTRNRLKEKQAKLEVLQTADKANPKEINSTIDEIAAIQAEGMKLKASNRQKIRSLLTDEQRILFDGFAGGEKNKVHSFHFRAFPQAKQHTFHFRALPQAKQHKDDTPQKNDKD